MITKTKFDEFDGHEWFILESDTRGKAVLQLESGVIYDSVAMRDDDQNTYVECDDPDWCESDSSETDPSETDE